MKSDAITDVHPKNEITIESRLEIFRRIVEGVIAIQKIGMVHGDLKLNNILVALEANILAKLGVNGLDAVVITDFGQAKEIAEIMESMAGTPGFASPEQAHGGRHRKSDNYALGIMLAALTMDWTTFWNFVFAAQPNNNIRKELLNSKNPFKPLLIEIIIGLMSVSTISNLRIYRTLLYGSCSTIYQK